MSVVTLLPSQADLKRERFARAAAHHALSPIEALLLTLCCASPRRSERPQRSGAHHSGRSRTTALPTRTTKAGQQLLRGLRRAPSVETVGLAMTMARRFLDQLELPTCWTDGARHERRLHEAIDQRSGKRSSSVTLVSTPLASRVTSCTLSARVPSGAVPEKVALEGSKCSQAGRLPPSSDRAS